MTHTAPTDTAPVFLIEQGVGLSTVDGRLHARVTHAGSGLVLVVVRGEIDMIGGPALWTLVAPFAEDAGLRLLVFDFSEVTFLGCRGLSILLELRAVLDGGARMRLVTRHPAVLRLLTMTDQREALGLCDDIAAALSGHPIGDLRFLAARGRGQW